MMAKLVPMPQLDRIVKWTKLIAPAKAMVDECQNLPVPTFNAYYLQSELTKAQIALDNIKRYLESAERVEQERD